MNRLHIYQANQTETTSVSNYFIDELMPYANDAQLKIYLLLLRLLPQNIPTSVTELADRFNYTEKDVLRALRYWEERGLVALEYTADGSLHGIRVEKNAMPPAREAEPALRAGKRKEKSELPKQEMPKQEMQKKEPAGSEEAGQILFVAEQYLARPLTRTEVQTFLFFYEELGFSADLIDYLVQHCVELGKKDIRYMERVALAWKEQGVTTPEEAGLSASRHDKGVMGIMQALGKYTAPAPRELEYIHRWIREYGFSQELIRLACDKTVIATDKNRFAYADGILQRWQKLGVKSTQEVALLEKSAPKQGQTPAGRVLSANNRFNHFAQNSYDFESLEQSILSN